MLVAGMISAHVVQLIAADPGHRGLGGSDLVNLVTVSGFLPAFGLSVGLSARSRPWEPLWEPLWEPRPRRAPPALLLLLALHASSFGYLLLVEREAMTAGLVPDVLTTRVLFGWSELLTAFLVLYLLIAAWRPLLIAMGTQPRWLLSATVACVARTLVSTDRLWPLIGGLIGHREYPNFPVLPYLPWVLVGIHLGAQGRRIEAETSS